ncbi:RNA polymerase sigma-70 factor, ECF subfamily [Bryocella elongata]|uniref:RNA polymerase sigma-70 factor, ECF subfamily n=1 Tax=Bryocella elongata TaxID=863522 RepID=A0A1H6CC31_9BACT|nr:RNA polymerase sigma factor [Bryocella elongata]SEG70569.1 RNA polymerase sigma-70 factor, ECF subfamily [Bryocella elongata]
MASATIPAMFDRGLGGTWTGLLVRREPGGAAPGARKPSDPRPPVEMQRGAAPEEPQVRAEASSAAAEEARAMAAVAQRALAGDSAAWEQIARSQHKRIYGICYRFTGSPTEAEDLTQDAFMKIYRNLASFDATKGGFNTWVTTLTRNLLVDNYRRTRMDRASESLDEPLSGEDEGGPSRAERLADGGRNQEQHVSGLELKAQIQAALKQVSPELREAVILRDLEDMDYKEIAEVLGVPQGTVKSRISRGRAELARLLKSMEGQVM